MGRRDAEEAVRAHAGDAARRSSGTSAAEQYVDILAFLLSANDVPAGSQRSSRTRTSWRPSSTPAGQVEISCEASFHPRAPPPVSRCLAWRSSRHASVWLRVNGRRPRGGDGRVEDLRRGSGEHALLPARSDQQGQLLEAEDRLAAEHQRLRAAAGHALLGDAALCRQRALHDGRDGSHGRRAQSRRPARCCGSTSKTKGRAARTPRAAARGAVSRTGRAPNGSDQRIIYVTPGYRMIALDAKTGEPLSTFGHGGVVDLKLDNDQDLDLVTADIGLNATPLVAGDVIVVGAAHRFSGSPRTMNNARGYVRGFDVKTGKRLWIFHTVPKPGEYRLRHVARGERRSQRQHRRVGAVQRRPRSRSRLRAGRDADRRLLRRQPAGQYAVRREPGRARHQDRQAQVALPDDASRPLGLRPAVRPRALRRRRQRPARESAGAADQAGVPLRAQSRNGRADLADRRARRAAVDGPERTDQPDAAVSDEAAAVRSPGRVG